MSQNDITCTILDNGTVRIDTDGFAGPVHAAAEKALQWISSELGNDVSRTKRTDVHTYAHNGNNVHSHDGIHYHTH